MLSSIAQTPRWRAAGLHLLASMLAAGVVAALVFGLWYPQPYREISGGRSLFTVLILVDVVLGPLLTALVFNQSKPRAELLRDMAVVVALQLSALAYGIWSMYQARPVYLVHEVDRLVVVSAADVDPSDLAKAAEPFRSLPFAGVRLIGVRDHRDTAEKTRAFELALAGKDISVRPEYWQELSEQNKIAMRAQARPIGALLQRSPTESATVQAWLKSEGRKASQVHYLPMVSREIYWVALLNLESLQIVGYLPIDGF